jgi:PEP-CTERM motif
MKFAAILTLTLASAASSQAALVAYWNFNGLSIATAAAPGSGSVPASITADQGTGTLTLSGFWNGTVDDFAGSAINALGADPAEESLSLVSAGPAAGPFPGNGSAIQITLSLAGMVDPIITFATRGTSSGFNTGTWSWSTDGINFTNAAGNTATTSTIFALATMDLSTANALDNAASVTLRYTLSGATSNSGNNRLDNLQINATPVPEPSATLVLALGALGLTARRRR